MHGLPISYSLSICEHLFVDDMGIMIPTEPEFFKQVEECIALYERASRARLNIRKSSIIPLGLRDVLQWLIDKGYVIISERVISWYLGPLLDTMYPPTRYNIIVLIGSTNVSLARRDVTFPLLVKLSF